MRTQFLVVLFVACFPTVRTAQQPPAENLLKLSEAQKQGQLLFQQRCSICHTVLSATNRKTYGPLLGKDVVNNNEDLVRKAIMDGQEDLMPGFKYGLTRADINDIIEFLKTVDKPSRSTAWY
jgi:mono/diheme cytochrome c family protein